MKFIKFLAIGILFGIILSKGEIISWYRIQEMFRFQSFHMYGVIGSAVMLGMLAVQFIKRTKLKDSSGSQIIMTDQEPGYARNLIGGTIFGLGWAITGACPGPLFVLLGHHGWVLLLAIVGALIGTFTYGVVAKYLIH